jgi:hypothetical protein
MNKETGSAVRKQLITGKDRTLTSEPSEKMRRAQRLVEQIAANELDFKTVYSTYKLTPSNENPQFESGDER